MQYRFSFKGNEYLFNKDLSDINKYIVFTCAKNEDDYLVEWVEHYLSIGFDKIIIADNNDDNTIAPNLLSKYIKNGHVEIFDCHGLTEFQLYIYNMFLAEGNYKWCAYFDCDEFLELNIHNDIKEFLDGINENCVLINWLMFGSNGKIKKENKPIQERFSLPVFPIPFMKENMYVKPIIRGGIEGYRLIDTHTPLNDNGEKYNLGGCLSVDYPSHVYYPVRYRYAYIKHYYTKSFEEWMNGKTKRGWPDEMPKILKESNYFILQNEERFPINKFSMGLFVDNDYFSNLCKEPSFMKAIEKYNIFDFRAETRNVYSLLLHVSSFMKNVTGKIIMLPFNCVDDTLYAYLMEYAFETGNKVLLPKDDSEKWKIFSKYSQTKEGFYYKNCL